MYHANALPVYTKIRVYKVNVHWLLWDTCSYICETGTAQNRQVDPCNCCGPCIAVFPSK